MFLVGLSSVCCDFVVTVRQSVEKDGFTGEYDTCSALSPSVIQRSIGVDPAWFASMLTKRGPWSSARVYYDGP